MNRAMNSGVSGLRIHQTKMDVIGNNIANVSTIGFKSSRVTFNEIFSQTLQGASGASESAGGRNPMQVGLGASISSIDTLMTEGVSQRTDNPLDVKIVGDGFFIVRDADGCKFTRAGAFRLDEAGNLCNPEGLNVMGWKPNAQGNIVKEKVSKIQILNPANVYSPPTTTTNAYFSGNINKNDDNLTPIATAPGIATTFSIYDSQGYKYTVDARIKATATAGQYDISIASIKDENGAAITTVTSSGTATIIFGADGKLDPASPTNLTLTMTGTYKGATFSNIDIDLTGLTQIGGKTTAEAIAGDVNGLGAGNKAGRLSNYDIGPDGKIYGKYSNNDTKLLGQIALAKFQNPAGLQKVGNNLFEVTNNSGEFDGIGVDATAIGSSLNGGVLEMSNVDLSQEFTEMITTQRGFQANSRIITVSDEMLQELVNLKR